MEFHPPHWNNRCLSIPFVALAAVLVASSTVIPGVRGLTPSIGTAGFVPSSNDPVGFTSYQVIEHPLPQGSTQPWAITTDTSGDVWFVEQQSNQIGSYSPSTGQFNEFAIPTKDSLPEGIAVDASGNVWITELNSEKLGELERGTGSVVEVSIPQSTLGLACGSIGVTPSVSGNVWLTCEFSNQIDEYSPANHSFLEFSLPIFYSAPLQILFDSAGGLWFTAANADLLGYAKTSQLVNGTSDGIQEFAPINQTYISSIANPAQPSGGIVSSLWIPSQMAFSPSGGSLWITDHGAGSFDRYDLVSKTLVKYFTSRPSIQTYPDSLPNGIAVDAEGNVWIAEHYGNRIAEFNPDTGSLTEYRIPCCGSGIAGTLYLTLGENGTVWFSEFFGNAIGELVPVRGTTSISLTLPDRSVPVASNGNVTARVDIVSREEGYPTSIPMTFTVAGISRTGELGNTTYDFKPDNMSLFGNATGSTFLHLEPNGLKPGSYELTISARSSEGNVTISTFLQLVVHGYEFPWVLVGIASLIVASVALAFAVRMRFVRHQGERLQG
jgi:virginiamycin B lyase